MLIGIRILSVLMGFNALLAFVVAAMRIFLKGHFPPNEPGMLMAVFMGVIGIYFVWIAIGLWNLKNSARIACLITAILIFILLSANLLQHHIIPDLKGWWHFYIYPVVIFYLLLPAVRKRFTSKDNK